MASKTSFFDLSDERGVLRTSIAATLAVASIGIVFGLLSGSFSIMFDGVYSLVDASMSLLSLFVVNLIATYAMPSKDARRLEQRFTMGFWHLEPMVLGLNSVLLIGVAAYALVNAVSSLLEGGRDLEFGFAMIYAVVVALVCFAMAFIERRANRTVGSEFVRLDMKGWLMSGGITAALLFAFGLGYGVQGTQWQWISPYIDPAVLALVCLVIIPLPVSTVRQAFADMLLMAPAELKTHVDRVAKAFTEKHGFAGYRAYVARVGRARQIELFFVVPEGTGPRDIAHWDALRDELGAELGTESPDRWLTIVFTGDPEWAD